MVMLSAQAFAFPLTSTSYTIDMGTFNGGGTVKTSSTYKVNDTIVGSFGGGQDSSTSYKLDTGLQLSRATH